MVLDGCRDKFRKGDVGEFILRWFTQNVMLKCLPEEALRTHLP